MSLQIVIRGIWEERKTKPFSVAAAAASATNAAAAAAAGKNVKFCLHAKTPSFERGERKAGAC